MNKELDQSTVVCEHNVVSGYYCAKCSKVVDQPTPTQEWEIEFDKMVEEGEGLYQYGNKDEKTGDCPLVEVGNTYREFIHNLLTKEREDIKEKLKHIAMVDNGKEPKYYVKDILEILSVLEKGE